MSGKPKGAACTYCQRTRTVDADGACPTCHELTVLVQGKLRSGTLCRPVARRLTPPPTRRGDVVCSACGERFERPQDQDTEHCPDGRALYLHQLCADILVRLGPAGDS